MFNNFKFIILAILAFFLGIFIEHIYSKNEFLEVDYIEYLGIAVVHNKLNNTILCFRHDSNSKRGYEEVECHKEKLIE